VRVIAGRFGGQRLVSLGKGDPASHLRPTPDRVRESLFSILAARLEFEGLCVLDVFAGTGALGFEALSRGAARVVFVENGRVGQKLVAQNIAKLGVTDQARLVARDATRPGPAVAEADLVFLDPPYGSELGQTALSALQQGGWIAPKALIVWEDSMSREAPDGFAKTQDRRFGNTWLTFLTPQKP